MAREPINTGAATLGLMSQNVANIAQARKDMLNSVNASLGSIGKAFSDWGDRIQQEKHNEWLRNIEQAKFNETKRANLVGEGQRDKQIGIEKQKADTAQFVAEDNAKKTPSEIAKNYSQAGDYNQDAKRKRIENEARERVNANINAAPQTPPPSEPNDPEADDKDIQSLNLGDDFSKNLKSQKKKTTYLGLSMPELINTASNMKYD